MQKPSARNQQDKQSRGDPMNFRDCFDPATTLVAPRMLPPSPRGAEACAGVTVAAEGAVAGCGDRSEIAG